MEAPLQLFRHKRSEGLAVGPKNGLGLKVGLTFVVDQLCHCGAPVSVGMHKDALVSIINY